MSTWWLLISSNLPLLGGISPLSFIGLFLNLAWNPSYNERLWEHLIQTWSVFFGSLYSFCCCCYSVAKSCLTLCDPTDCSTPGFPVLHYQPEFAQTHVHWVDDAIQPSHPLLPPSPPAFNLSQHPSLFQWVSSSHQVAKVLELPI